jgi:ABC-type multidrug transport system ATPase subunit
MTVIESRGLVKRYRATLAVDSLSFDVRPGTVTGFLGPNGAGKSTTMRMIMGLDQPDGGRVTIGGQRYGELRWPLREVGALLEAKAFHPGRTARAHLTALAASNAIGRRRGRSLPSRRSWPAWPPWRRRLRTPRSPSRACCARCCWRAPTRRWSR